MNERGYGGEWRSVRERVVARNELTLTEFLGARLAEDELVAQEARQHEYLSARRDSSVIHWENDVSGYAFISTTSGRILAECAAKRRIVEIHRHADPYGSGAHHHCPTRPPDSLADSGAFRDSDPCDTLRALALPHADHPDYRDEWKP